MTSNSVDAPLNDGVEHRFLAGLHSFDAEAKTATFYIMNTSANRNRWGVTDQALAEALPTLKGKPLGMGAGYKIDRHYPDGQTMDSGVFTAYKKPGAYALGTAQIRDAETVARIKSGELGPVSVVIHSFRDVCSKCNANLSTIKDFSAHPCIAKADAYAKVESFRFKRVDFVDVPAYPQAGLIELAAKFENQFVPLELLASFYVSQAQPPTTQGREPNQSTNQTKQKEGTQMSEKELEKLSSLEQANEKLATDLAAAVSKASAAEGDMKAMKAQLDALVKEKHETLIAETFEARTKAGLVQKPEEEKQFLAKFNDETLALLKGDALKVANVVVQTNESPIPKTRYGKTTEDPLLAAVNEQRIQRGLSALKELN